MAEAGALTPLTLYHRRLADGLVEEDAGQAAALDLLNQLFLTLTHTDSPSGWLGKWRAKKQPTPSGLYLYGGVGRGKTMLMNLFFEALGEDKAQRLHFHDFMVAAHDAINQRRAADARDPIDAAADQLMARGKVLCFDEMEVRDIADAMIVQRLFQALFERGLVMIATSNRHPRDLYLGGLHRDRFLPFIHLIQQKCDLHEIEEGADWRGRALAGIDGWMMPRDARVNDKLEALFQQLCRGHPIAREQVMSAGRAIEMPAAGRDIGLADFQDLCGQPLGARDYLVLADRYAGLMLKNIPQMGDAAQNEARRFMWLIDAFYDRGRFLIASAETEIDQIYSGRQWAFEFDRTISRLGEMTHFTSPN